MEKLTSGPKKREKDIQNLDVFVCTICSSGVWLVIGGKVGSGRRGALSSSGRMKGLYQQAVSRPGSAATGRGGADHRQVGGQ